MNDLLTESNDYSVVSALDGWVIEVHSSIPQVIAQYVADTLGVGIDYIVPEDLAEVIRRCVGIKHRAHGMLNLAFARLEDADYFADLADGPLSCYVRGTCFGTVAVSYISYDHVDRPGLPYGGWTESKFVKFNVEGE